MKQASWLTISLVVYRGGKEKDAGEMMSPRERVYTLYNLLGLTFFTKHNAF